MMNKRLAPTLRAGVSAALILTAACVSAAAQTPKEQSLRAALRELYSDGGDVRYFLKWFDLNGDGREEAIAHVAGPGACGSGGCPTHVFAPSGDAYRLVSTVGLTRPPIMASTRRSHGWRNLLVFVAGGGIRRGHYAELRFDGRTYPKNPTVRPAREAGGKPPGELLIKDFEFYTEGKSLGVD